MCKSQVIGSASVCKSQVIGSASVSGQESGFDPSMNKLVPTTASVSFAPLKSLDYKRLW